MGSSFIMIGAVIIVIMLLVFGVTGLIKTVFFFLKFMFKTVFLLGMFVVGVVIGSKLADRNR